MPTLTYQSTAQTGANASSYTFAGLAIGTASATRGVIVCVYQVGGSGGVTDTVSVGGTSLSLVVLRRNGANSAGEASIWVGTVTTGSTADVVVTLTAKASRCGVAVYSVDDITAVELLDTGDGIGDPTDMSLNVQAGGFAVAIAGCNSGGAYGTWAGLTEDVDSDLEGSNAQFSAAHLNITSTSTPLTVTADPASSSRSAGVSASWRVPIMLTAESGSFALSGQAVSLKQSYAVAAGAGSFSLSGQSVNLEHGRNLAVGAGSFSLSGQDVALTYTPVGSPVMEAGAGVFVLTGQDVALTHGHPVAAEAGSFTLTGQDVGIYHVYRLTAKFGAYILSGQDTGLTQTHNALAAEYGDLALAGQPVSLEYGRALMAEYGAYAITGQDVAFLRALRLNAEYGSFILSGQSVILGNIFKLGVGCGTFALTGQDVSLIYLPNVIGTVADLDEITTSPTALTNITTTRSIGNSITSSPDFRVIN